MMGLLALVFLAALVGIAKPYVGNLTRKHFAMGAAAAFVGMMIVAPTPPPTSDTDAKSVPVSAAAPMDEGSKAPMAASPTTGVGEAEPLPASKWQYSENKDEMRGTTSRYASLTSENEIDMDFPYGSTAASLMVRKSPEDGLNVMFRVDKGQVLCNSFSNTFLSVKFDDGPVQRFECTDASDGSSETAFFTSESRMLNGVKKAKRTMVEAEFFQKGRQQFVFESAGLKWE